jgi:hypothetical protein
MEKDGLTPAGVENREKVPLPWTLELSAFDEYCRFDPFAFFRAIK